MRIPTLALALLVLSAPAFAAELPDATQDFIDKASVANKFEIDTSQLAL